MQKTDQLKSQPSLSNIPVTGQPSQSTRPRSGCSETSFNFDTPHTPHFEQKMTPPTPRNNSADTASRNGGGLASAAGGAALNFRQSEKNLFFGDNFAAGNEKAILVFVEPPNKKLCCPLCKSIFKDPVITTCGHTFCKICVRQSTDEVCPIDRKPSKYIVDNIALSEQIGELYVHCKYGCKETPSGYVVDDQGCPNTVRISERYLHEEECDFAPMTCPNNVDCPEFAKRDLEHHLQHCSSVSCPNKKYGCKFSDTKANLDEHIRSCIFEKVKEVLKEREGTIDILKQQNKSAKEDIEFLYTSLRGLSQRFDNLETEKDQLIEHVNKLSHVLDTVCKESQEARKERQLALEEMDHLKQHFSTAHYPSSGPYDPEPIIKCKGTCVGHDGPVWCLSVVNDFLFSGSSDNHVKVWDTSCNYKCVKTLGGHSGIVLSLTVYGSRLYSGSQDTKILVWNIDNDFELEDTLEAHDNPVCTLAASRGMLFSGSLKNVKAWDATSGKHQMKKEITGFNHWVRALYATDKELYCGSYQTIEIYNLDSLELTTTLKTYGGSVYSICVTDKHILCGTYEKVIHVWETATMEQVTTLPGHNGTVYALACMPSAAGVIVFSASYDRTIRVWSMSNMICKQTLIRHAGSVACLAVSKGRVFSGGIDSMVKVWQ